MDPNTPNPQYQPAAPGMPGAAPQPTQNTPIYSPQALPGYGQQSVLPQYPQQMPGMTPVAPNAPIAGQPAGPQPKSNPNSTQNTLQIAEIRDGVVIMNDGSYRSVIMVKSINFDLMSPQEREAVEYSYQGFLNSL